MPTDEENFLPKEPLDLPVSPSQGGPIPPLQNEASEPGIPTNAPADILSNDNTHQVRTLLSWSAPGRPFQKKSKDYYLTALLIVLFVEVILFLFSQYLLMMVVLSLVFVSFALASVAPRDFHYRISSEGITIEDHFYLWQELYDFYFKKRGSTEVLHLRTHAFIPGELIITLGDMDREHVKSVLLPYLPYREVIRPTFTEKSGDWLARNFPLEK